MARRTIGWLLLCTLAIVGLRLASGSRPVAEREVSSRAAGPRRSLPSSRRSAVVHAGETAPAAEPSLPPVAAPPDTAPPSQQAPGKPRPGDSLFDAGLVPRIAIHLDRRAWRSLEHDPRAYVEASVTVDGKTYSRVGVHLKGAAGSFQPIGAQPALTLKFNEFVDGQELHGLRKLHLNNSVQDRSYLNELLAGELFRAVGVPAARATHALVTINGRDLGLYLVKEAFDRRFLRRHFEDTSGNLYDGGFCNDINGGLENDTHRESTDRTDLERLVDASLEPDLEARWRRLGEVLDVTRFISYMALEVWLWDWDGYPMKPNNYRIYHDPKSRRLVFLPHGMDQLLGQPEGSIQPDMGGMVARALLETPAGRAAYRERLAEIHAQHCQLEALEKRVDELRRRLLPLVRSDSGQEQELASHMAMVRDLLRERHRSVERQLLQKPPQPIRLGADGIVSLASERWYPEKDTGGVEAREVENDNGVQLLIDAHGNHCLGSWRCRVLLGPGTYAFRGRVRTTGVVPLADRKGAGAGLRLGGSQTPRRNQAVDASDWSDLEHVFEVQRELEEVELVCELRATGGRAWFDRASLRLVGLDG